ncbi:glutathione S-transferase [Thozetella sp. PMI_491]|nr:glutathione S-transferase [Thozetella sp. PMI_491]
MTLIVHHLQVSQSERITWLCEELGIEYVLKIYQRAPILAPPEYKALHPMGAAPVIQDGDLTLAESGACIEYLSHMYGNTKLFVKPESPSYADFLYWWHWGNSSFQPVLTRAMMMRSAGVSTEGNVMATVSKDRLNKCLALLDTRLQDHEWLAGNEFTAADIMVVFSLTSFRYWYAYSLQEYGNILRYLARIGKREGYMRALKKIDPKMEPALEAECPQRSW